MFDALPFLSYSSNYITHAAAYFITFLIIRYLYFLHGSRNVRQYHAAHRAPPPAIPEAYPLQHIFGASFGISTYAKRLSKQHPSLPAFTIPIFRTNIRIIASPALATSLLSSAKNANHLDLRELVFLVYETFLGDSKQSLRKIDQDLFWGPVQRIVNDMMRSSFVETSLTTLSMALSTRVFELGSAKAAWGKTAGTLKGPGWSEGFLHMLLRDFVGHMATDILMGPDFLRNFPAALPNLWAMDDKLDEFIARKPAWPPSMRNAVAARNRLVSAIREHHVAYNHFLNGRGPGTRWSKIDEMSGVMKDRIKVFQTTSDFEDIEEERAWMTARANAILFFALNVNANQIIFWMILYVYSNPTLLEELRAEVAPYLNDKVDPETRTPRLDIDIPGITSKFLLLHSVFLESMRLETSAVTFRDVKDDFSVSISAADAEIYTREYGPITYMFEKGDKIIYEHGLSQTDACFWPDPETFNARRFLVKANDGRMRIEYHTLQPWGEGSSMCKRRKFAEGEVMVTVAAVLHCWDLEPVNGMWRHPGRKGAAAGAHKPTGA